MLRDEVREEVAERSDSVGGLQVVVAARAHGIGEWHPHPSTYATAQAQTTALAALAASSASPRHPLRKLRTPVRDRGADAERRNETHTRMEVERAPERRRREIEMVMRRNEHLAPHDREQRSNPAHAPSTRPVKGPVVARRVRTSSIDSQGNDGAALRPRLDAPSFANRKPASLGSRGVASLPSRRCPTSYSPCSTKPRRSRRSSASLPPGIDAIVVDNGSTDDSGGNRPRWRARWSSKRRGAASVPRASPGSPRPRPTSCASWTATVRSTVPISRASWHPSRPARRSRPRRPAVRARAPGRCTRGSRTERSHGSCGAAPQLPLRDLGPMRAARRERSARPRPRRSALRLAARDGAARRRTRGWRIRRSPVRYAPRIGRSKVTGTIGGTARTVRDMARVLR